jgi:hypothetical protein
MTGLMVSYSDKAKNLDTLIFTRQKSLSTKAEQLEWRRSKGIEMGFRGMSQTGIDMACD